MPVEGGGVCARACVCVKSLVSVSGEKKKRKEPLIRGGQRKILSV